MKTEMFISDEIWLDNNYQEWLDKNPNIEIISTSLTSLRSHDGGHITLFFIVTYK